MRAVVVLALGGVLAAPASAEPLDVDVAASRARTALERRMVDYQSARFLDVTAVAYAANDGVSFCGQVNAKNLAGIYTGYQRFVVNVGSNDAVVHIGDADLVADATCKSGLRRVLPGDASAKLAPR